ncbi:serine/threonine-protein kinase [Aquimonas sp.]|uniref:serine/threonine-protein kinase n=1 Tax=Aquimonas sp. TaxID=1872588 RepID=UPI0037C097D1
MSATIIHSNGGLQVPGYRILRPLGAGGMASVYLAVQESLDREVALKVMSPQLAADREFTERFLKEGRITAKLSHRNLVTVFDIGSHQGLYYLAAEYIAGGTLSERIREGLSVPQILDIVSEVARGLHFAHEKGVVHRDVKPSNILFKSDGTVVLADFGIAKAMDTTSTATMAGSSIGTPDYMSPEQARGEPVDGRSDLYALGVMLYEMLIGRPPFDGSDPFAVALAHITQPIPMLPSEFAWLQPVLDKMMAKRPAERFASGEAFALELDRVRTRMPKAQATQMVRHDTAARQAIASAATVPLGTRQITISSGRRTGLIAAAVIVAIGIGIGAVLWQQDNTVSVTEPAVVIDTPPVVTPPSLPTDVSELDALLLQAESYLSYGMSENTLGRRLVFPDDESAVGLFRQALQLDPNNAQANEGLRMVAEFYATRAAKMCERTLWDACRTSASDGLQADPQRADLLELMHRAERGIRGD